MFKVGDLLELKSHSGSVIKIIAVYDNGKYYDCIPISGYGSRKHPWYDQELLPHYWNLIKPAKKKRFL